ncbi:MAG TPA: hypothetical protein VK525_22525 [Candidatus Saccharimonadales bacterium]|nr:hypothetical protein [Candidatus Saccharimonadales bacterium]
MAGSKGLLYTGLVQNRNGKFAASLLLLLMVLDLSSAGVCIAGTFPGSQARTDVALSSVAQADAQPVSASDDDGCFCCCTHILPGSFFLLESPSPMITAEGVRIVSGPTALPQTLFHPPKQ